MFTLLLLEHSSMSFSRSGTALLAGKSIDI